MNYNNLISFKTYQDLSLFEVPQRFRGRGPVVVALWQAVQASIFAASPRVLYGWRRFLLRMFGAQVGDGVLVRPSVRITYPWKLSLGDRAWIGDEALLHSLDHIHIGAHTVVSQRAFVCAGTHDTASRDFGYLPAEICIGDQVWIAAGAFVGPGSRLARAASSVPEVMFSAICRAG